MKINLEKITHNCFRKWKHFDMTGSNVHTAWFLKNKDLESKGKYVGSNINSSNLIQNMWSYNGHYYLVNYIHDITYFDIYYWSQKIVKFLDYILHFNYIMYIQSCIVKFMLIVCGFKKLSTKNEKLSMNDQTFLQFKSKNIITQRTLLLRNLHTWYYLFIYLLLSSKDCQILGLRDRIKLYNVYSITESQCCLASINSEIYVIHMYKNSNKNSFWLDYPPSKINFWTKQKYFEKIT